VGLLAAGLALTACPAPASAAETPVSLVVGLRSADDVVDRLERTVDVVQSEPLAGGVIVDVPASQATEATDVLRADPAVSYVERDHVAHMAVTTPDDPSYPSQWGIAATRVNTAWDTTRGSGTVTVAVVDTGVKALPDLAGRLLPGRDFVNNDDNADDDNGHGTMTAGVIAAAGDNGTGIAGICWTCKILPVKVLDANGSGSYSAIGDGIRYAADQGADIINLSLGGSADGQVLRDAVAYAVSRGALVIAAAGNEGSDTPHFPAAIPAVLAVGASTDGDARYSWSNYGSAWVDIAAPGCNPAQSMGGVVGQFCGTSSATPFTAGVAALLASTSPAPSASAIWTALTSSAVPLAGGWVSTTSGRIDAAAAFAALPAVQVADQAPPSVSFRFPTTAALARGVLSIGGRAGDDVGIARVQLLLGTRLLGTDTTSPYAFRWSSAAYTGPVTLTLRTYDWAGQVAVAHQVVTLDNTAPVVRITSAPANGARGVRKTKYVTATASDRYGVRVMDLIVNGKVTQRFTGTSHRFSVQTWKQGKAMTVRVRAYDRAGNVSYTPSRTWHR
jgi:subtilisin family serine protease